MSKLYPKTAISRGISRAPCVLKGQGSQANLVMWVRVSRGVGGKGVIASGASLLYSIWIYLGEVSELCF